MRQVPIAALALLFGEPLVTGVAVRRADLLLEGPLILLTLQDAVEARQQPLGMRTSAARDVGELRFVPVKSAEAQATLLNHKARDFLIRQQTQTVNTIRAHLAEFGVVVAKGIHNVDRLLEPPGWPSTCWPTSSATCAGGSKR
jgi:hypothetical protein